MVRPERDDDNRQETEEARVRAEVEALKQDLSALREDLRHLVKDVIAAGKAEAGEASEALSDAARSRLEEYGVDLDRLTDHVQIARETLQEHVERRPLTSVALALALGIMLGRIFRR